MVRFGYLLTGVLTLSFVVIYGVPAFAADQDCTPAQTLSGGCPEVSGSIDGKDVVVKVDLNGPVAGKSGDSSGDSKSSGSSRSGGAGSVPDKPVGPTVVRDNYTVTAPVSLSDIARFRPDPGTDLMQPNGWMIVGLSTNFFAHATQHVKSGTLLGQPASVRFTPARYAWAYGDGATRNTSTPGGTWASLRINEFDATPTSHIYRAPGKYFIDLTIGFTPEYKYAAGTDWIPIAGIVWVPANRLEAEASAGAKTVLFENECTINPAGAGC